MDVSIIIRTKNEAEFIGETLNRVEKQEFNGSKEVVIVDSGSTDATLEIVRGFDVTLVCKPQEEFTYGRSLNVGADRAKGHYIVNLSAHAVPKDENWLSNLVCCFEDRNVAGVYGKQISIGHLNPFEALRNEQFFGNKKIIFSLQNDALLHQLHFSNANSATRKDVWQRFNFNENVRYAEDILWQNEVMQAGFSIAYTPHSVVYHTHKVDIRKAYRNSRDCAYELASMKQKKKTSLSLVWDIGLFFWLVATSMFCNIKHICLNGYLASLKVAPWYVLAETLGWMAGRMEYRLTKGHGGGA